jgi:hypothetical protein
MVCVTCLRVFIINMREKKKVESLPTMIDIEDGHDTAPAENVEHLL